jgi:glycosyltransferase involved in cell wall biosynthesis
MVGRTRYELPLPAGLARKFGALEDRFDLRVLASAGSRDERGDATFRLQRPLGVRALEGPAFYGSLVPRIAAELRRFRPDAVVAQSPYEALAALAARTLVRGRAAVVLEVHGDWRTWARLYGSPLRGLVAPLGDRLALVAVRRADAVRTLSTFTNGIVRDAGVEPAATFTTYTELSAFSEPPLRPLPERPTALFVGVLERYKNVDGIDAAWRLAAPRLPGAVLRLVGDGRFRDSVRSLVTDLPAQTRWLPKLATAEVVAAMDESWALLLVSRSEGTPRVVLEALCRGRAVIGARAGGIPDVVEDGVTGLLVDPEDPEAIAGALVRVLSDRALAERMGAAGHARAAAWLYTPEQYAERMAELVERAVAGRDLGHDG